MSRITGTLFAPTAGGFAIRLIGLWLIATALLNVGAFERWVNQPLTVLYANVVSGAFKLIGVEHTVSGSLLTFPRENFSFLVEPMCTGLDVLIFYTGAVLAFPATGLARLKGLAIGVAFLFAINVFRIVTLYYMMAARPEWFDDFHAVFWQSLIVLLVGVLWYAWASARPANPPAAA